MNTSATFAARLDALRNQSQATDRENAATLAAIQTLISDLQEMGERWDREDAE